MLRKVIVMVSHLADDFVEVRVLAAAVAVLGGLVPEVGGHFVVVWVVVSVRVQGSSEGCGNIAPTRNRNKFPNAAEIGVAASGPWTKLSQFRLCLAYTCFYWFIYQLRYTVWTI
jgi:hypothetical protein